MAERPTPNLEFYNPSTGSIDKQGVRVSTLNELSQAHRGVADKFTTFVNSPTLDIIEGYRTPEEIAQIHNNLNQIRETGAEKSQAWNVDNYLTSEAFEAKIKEKAQEYAEGHEDDPINNYWKALGNRHDQALAAASFFTDYKNQVDNLHEITEEDKDKAAYYLAENIRKYGAELTNADSRNQLVESGRMSQDEVNAALKAGLIQHADVASEFNTEQVTNGFANDEAWNEAVYKVAAGVLEDRLVKQIENLAQVDEAAEILKRAEEIYNQRTNAVAETPTENEPEAPVEPEPIVETATTDTTPAVEEPAARVEPIVAAVDRPSQVAPVLVAEAPHTNGTNGTGTNGHTHHDIPGTIHLGPAAESAVATMARVTGENSDEVNAVLTRMRNGEDALIDPRIRPGEIEDEELYPDEFNPTVVSTEPAPGSIAAAAFTMVEDGAPDVFVAGNTTQGEVVDDVPAFLRRRPDPQMDNPSVDDYPRPAVLAPDGRPTMNEDISDNGTPEQGQQADDERQDPEVVEAPIEGEWEEMAAAAEANNAGTQTERANRLNAFLARFPYALAIRDYLWGLAQSGVRISIEIGKRISEGTRDTRSFLWRNTAGRIGRAFNWMRGNRAPENNTVITPQPPRQRSV